MKMFQCYRLNLVVAFCFLVSSTLFAETNSKANLKKIEADYRVKASFFALPLKAKITVRKLEPHIYSADISLKSPFFKVDQKETALIKECKVQLLSLTSKGSRIGSNDWDEQVEIVWPEGTVIYSYENSKQTRYESKHEPTGFTSFFAHQYTSLFKSSKNKTLTYTQSTKGWETSYIYKGNDEQVENHFFKQDVDADRFVTPRSDMPESDMPTVWYVPDLLAAIPLKMTMKLGVFKLDVSLKDLDVKPESAKAFFNEWGC